MDDEERDEGLRDETEGEVGVRDAEVVRQTNWSRESMEVVHTDLYSWGTAHFAAAADAPFYCQEDTGIDCA